MITKMTETFIMNCTTSKECYLFTEDMELHKKDQFHDRERQLHRQLADIISSLPEEQEGPEEENSINSDSGATFICRKVKIK